MPASGMLAAVHPANEAAMSNPSPQHEAASRRPRRAARHVAVAVAALAALLPAAGAHAQTSACDRLKASLAERISPGAGGYTLEAVPAGDAVPPGAKVIGTCEGGARRILLRRPGTAASPPTVAAARETQPVAAPAAAAVPAAIAVDPKPDARAEDTPAPSPAPVPAQAPPVATIEPTGPAAEQRWTRYAPWVLAPLLMLLGAALWAWIAHRRAYDAAGLPRGPRLD
jgi:hypothetical protein